jgi:hypothetical protein
MLGKRWQFDREAHISSDVLAAGMTDVGQAVVGALEGRLAVVEVATMACSPPDSRMPHACCVAKS